MIVNGIDTKDISIVVQGAVTKATSRTLETVKKFLPGATVILSTWKHQDISELPYDILVENEDPGAFPCDALQYSVMNNINRQLISTQNGLRHCATLYAAKIRSDFYLESADFLKCFNKYKKYDPEFCFVKERIVGCTVYSRNPRSKITPLTMAYCPSDFFFFGYSEDLKKLFDRPLISDVNEKMFFELYPENKSQLNYKDALCQFMPEQSIWMGFIKKYIADLDCRHRDDITEKNIILTEKTFANNLVLYSSDDLGVCASSQTLFSKGIPENCLTHEDWVSLYRCYCENDCSAMKKFLATTAQKDKNYFRSRQTHSAITQRGNSLKGEPSYFEIQELRDIFPLIDKYNYISFDIFDTLLYRRTAPDWQAAAQTSEYVQMLLASKGIVTSVAEIDSLRNQFVSYYEEKSISNGGSREYRIREVMKSILRLYGISDEEGEILSAQISENEVLREEASIYVNQDAASVLEYIRKKEKRIIAISDMYLSRADIERLLHKFGLAFDEVYVSSESCRTKADGKLYQYVLEDLSIKSAEILHIGDNRLSDVLKANENGIDSVYYFNAENMARKKSIEEQVLTSAPKTYIAKELALDENPQTFPQYIQKYFSYDIINFVYDMAKKALKERLGNLFFLARDGTLYGEIYEKIKDQILLFNGLDLPKCTYVKLSRKDTACLINIKSVKDVIDRAYRVNPPNRFHIIHILGCFGVSLDVFDENEQREIVNHNTDLSYFEDIYMERVYPKMRDRQKKIVAYLTEIGFFKQERIGIVDIGWGGTSQRDIETYLRSNFPTHLCYGFYYACDNRAQELAPHYSQYHFGPDLYYSYSLQEFVVKGYTKDLEEVERVCSQQPELYQTLHLNFEARTQIKEDTERFVDAVNRLHLTPGLIRQATFPRMKEMVDKPPLSFVKILCDVKFSLDRKKGDNYLPLFQPTTSLKKLQEQYETARWVQATIRLSPPKLKRVLFYRKVYQKTVSGKYIPIGVKSFLKQLRGAVKRALGVE